MFIKSFLLCFKEVFPGKSLLHGHQDDEELNWESKYITGEITCFNLKLLKLNLGLILNIYNFLQANFSFDQPGQIPWNLSYTFFWHLPLNCQLNRVLWAIEILLTPFAFVGGRNIPKTYNLWYVSNSLCKSKLLPETYHCTHII